MESQNVMSIRKRIITEGLKNQIGLEIGTIEKVTSITRINTGIKGDYSWFSTLQDGTIVVCKTPISSIGYRAKRFKCKKVSEKLIEVS